MAILYIEYSVLIFWHDLDVFSTQGYWFDLIPFALSQATQDTS